MSSLNQHKAGGLDQEETKVDASSDVSHGQDEDDTKHLLDKRVRMDRQRENSVDTIKSNAATVGSTVGSTSDAELGTVPEDLLSTTIELTPTALTDGDKYDDTLNSERTTNVTRAKKGKRRSGRRRRGEPRNHNSGSQNGPRQKTHIYVAKFPLEWTEDNLVEKFSQFGIITHAKCLRHRKSNKPMGAGFIHYADGDSAQKAVAGMTGFIPTGASEPIDVRRALPRGSGRMSRGRARNRGRRRPSETPSYSPAMRAPTPIFEEEDYHRAQFAMYAHGHHGMTYDPNLGRSLELMRDYNAGLGNAIRPGTPGGSPGVSRQISPEYITPGSSSVRRPDGYPHMTPLGGHGYPFIASDPTEYTSGSRPWHYRNQQLKRPAYAPQRRYSQDRHSQDRRHSQHRPQSRRGSDAYEEQLDALWSGATTVRSERSSRVRSEPVRIAHNRELPKFDQAAGRSSRVRTAPTPGRSASDMTDMVSSAPCRMTTELPPVTESMIRSTSDPTGM